MKDKKWLELLRRSVILSMNKIESRKWFTSDIYAFIVQLESVEKELAESKAELALAARCISDLQKESAQYDKGWQDGWDAANSDWQEQRLVT